MRLRIVSAALAALAVTILACSENQITGPETAITAPSSSPKLDVAPPVLPSVRISELHYDNTGTDTGESIEISGPAGTDLTGWSLVLYNGASDLTYRTNTLSGTIPTTCSGRGVVVVTYPTDGIQNGSPDGIALVDASSNVVEYLSYEGSMGAVNGPAAGLRARDIGVSEVTSTPLGLSLHRNSAGTWFAPSTSSFGACNDDTTAAADTIASVTELPASVTLVPGATQQFTAAAKNAANTTLPGAMIGWNTSNASVATVDVNGLVTAVAPGSAQIIAVSTNNKADTSVVTVNAAPPPSGLSDVRFSEIHYDNTGTDADEKIEIEGPAGGDLSGWKIILYNGDGGASYSTVTLATSIPATCDTRGVVVVSYAVNGIQNGSPDAFALINSAGQVVEFLSYEGTMTASNGPVQGLLSVDIGVSENSAPVGRSLQRNGAGDWYGPYTNTFGACNPVETPPPSVFFSGRVPSDVALPVGFQDQLFATLQDASGNEIPTTFTWSAETPSVATIDADGVMTALTAGSATFRATAAGGITDTWTLPTTVATAGGTAMYAGNVEFGTPTDSDASDDFIITHPEYTSSFNKNRGTPNWVSYDL